MLAAGLVHGLGAVVERVEDVAVAVAGRAGHQVFEAVAALIGGALPHNDERQHPRTGAGVLALIVMGERSSDECRHGLEYLMTRPPGNRDGHVFYALYYCTQAMYQAGGKHWRSWYPKAAEYLLSTQRADGSWYDGPGQPYASAMGILALQVPAALLPIYQK